MSTAGASWQERLRASLWFWPSVAAAVALILALLLVPIRPVRDVWWATMAWPGDVASATALLQTVATSTMAATTLTFSLTVVALQLSSQQFSPRLLREFARNRFTQALLGILVSTFVISLTGLRGIHDGEPLPVVVIALASVMGVVSIGALLGFLGHLVRSLRVDTMMLAVRNETAATIHQTYPPFGTAADHRNPMSALGTGNVVLASTSGFVRVTRPEVLVAAARRLGLVVRMEVRPGDQVIQGSPIAEVFADGGGSAPADTEVGAALESGIDFGFERTLEQDAAFGFRQLTDIATKAISPGINDPVTAAHAIGYCADLLVELEGRELGGQQHQDDAGRFRVYLPDRDYRYYLDLVCSPLRRYGAKDPVVLVALLRMLRDCGASVRDEEQRGEIRRQADLVLDSMAPDLLPSDEELVRAAHRSVASVLEGRIADAYADRAGEGRSV